MGRFKIKRRKSDIQFSNFIRERDNWTCQKCGRVFDPENSEDRMRYHNSHYWRRGHEGTRFDPENCDGLCATCHEYADSSEGNRLWYEPFKRKQLGDWAYDLLEVRARTYKKRDDQMDLIIVKAIIQDYKTSDECRYIPYQ